MFGLKTFLPKLFGLKTFLPKLFGPKDVFAKDILAKVKFRPKTFAFLATFAIKVMFRSKWPNIFSIFWNH